MARKMKLIAWVSLLCTALSAVLFWRLGIGIYKTLAITFGTVFYHFAMRLLVGMVFDATMKNRADPMRKWYRPHAWERRLYAFLKVRRWRDKLPTYQPTAFDTTVHTWDEIVGAMCQAELVHETIVVCSFLPLVAAVWFGAFPVFLVTCVCAALFDLLFVILQRYNRPQVLRAMARRRKTKE